MTSLLREVSHSRALHGDVAVRMFVALDHERNAPGNDHAMPEEERRRIDQATNIKVRAQKRGAHRRSLRILRGLLVMRAMDLILRSSRIAGTQLYSRASSGKPSMRLLSTVS